MGKTYSVDLRMKVVSFIAGGGGKREASRIFNIGEDTIYRWLRLKALGDLSPKKRVWVPRKVDVDALREHVRLHPDHTLKEIGAVFNIAHKTVFVWLHRLQITRKKRQYRTKSAVKKIA